jgi:hypothetical protein
VRQEIKALLDHAQQTQVNTLLDYQITNEEDENFEWSLALPDCMFNRSWFDQKELISIRVYLKCAPLKDPNLRTLYRKIEKSKEERRRQAYQVPLSARYVANASPVTVDREEVTQAGIPARGEVQGTRGLLKASASGS